MEQFHSPYLSNFNNPANFIDPDGRQSIAGIIDSGVSLVAAMTADMTVTTLFEAFKGGGGMNGGASISGGAAIALKIHVFWQNVQTWVSSHYTSLEQSASTTTAGAGGAGWSHQGGNLVSGNGDNVQTLIDHLANEGYEINRDPNDWNNGSPTKPGLHMYDVYNTIKRYGYQDQNTTEGEVSIPLSAIEELVVKRAVKADVDASKPIQIEDNLDRAGEFVYEPLEDGWEIAGDFVFGRRTYIDKYDRSWDVGRDGKIIGLTPYSGSPDFGLGGAVGRLFRSMNQLNKLVKTGKVPKSIIRFDKGKIYGELDHVHFENGAALNINGTWKHGFKSLTSSEIKFLQENGWKIPQ